MTTTTTTFLDAFQNASIDYVVLKFPEPTTFSMDAVLQIRQVLEDHGWLQNYDGSWCTCELHFLQYFQRSEVGLEVVTRKGKFVKRLVKWIESFYNVKISPDLQGAFGNILRYDLLNVSTAYIKLTNQFDWKPGTFGNQEVESCFWQSKRLAKNAIHDAGGIAVQVYNENGQGVGRAWVMEVPGTNDMSIFNVYGNTTFGIIATALHQLSHTILQNPIELYHPDNFYKVRTVNFETDSGTLWINPGHGDGYSWVLPESPDSPKHDIVDFQAVPNGYAKCRNCANFVDLDDGSAYCKYCR